MTPLSSCLIASAGIFLDTLSHCHPLAKFRMEAESKTSLPFIGVELLNLAPTIKTKVYVKPTNAGSTTRAKWIIGTRAVKLPLC